MDALMVVLSAVAIAESMLLIAQGEEMSDKDDRIRFLKMENEELRRKAIDGDKKMEVYEDEHNSDKRDAHSDQKNRCRA